MAFFQWWYGVGWFDNIRKTRVSLNRLARNFSLGILVKTLFAPWKQIDANVGSSQPVADLFHRMLDRLVSRFVGFFVRAFTILAAVIMMFLLLLGRTLLIILWPILPLLTVVGLLYSLGVF